MRFLEKIFNRQPTETGPVHRKPYEPFTTKFDRIVECGDLDHVLGPLAKEDATSLNEVWTLYERKLAPQRTEWTLRGVDAASAIATQVPRNLREEVNVSILIDHSGSMREQSILMSALAADVTQDFLRNMGCRVEVLGYTTSSWKGGLSRNLWRKRGAPRHPGRLCDLLHIIYRPLDDMRVSSLGHKLRNMFRPDLLKENVDGEALLWASSRLLNASGAHRILLVLSDGVPVDDSTLQENNPGYLSSHLRQVVADLEAADRLSLMAIHIGHMAEQYYSNYWHVDVLTELGAVMIDIISEAILAKLAPT